MKLAVIGSRCFSSKEHAAIIFGVLDALRSQYPLTAIVSGACKSSPDAWAAQWAKERKVELIEFPADWSQGKGAGFARNTDIANACDAVCAFWDGTSKGTADTMKKAKAQGKPVFYDSMDGKGFRPF
jgi:YspA, cpYpsA-related SLOG family